MAHPIATVTLAAAACLFATACRSDPLQPVACTEEARPGIQVEVRDDGTGLPAGDGAVMTLEHELFTEVIDYALNGLTMWGAVERPGTWDVTIVKDGYLDWSRQGVQVPTTPDGCHVVTVHLEARLVPEPLP